jgi:endogenous inhibitor of DNA gyrase (YacG/DUF329 family)
MSHRIVGLGEIRPSVILKLFALAVLALLNGCLGLPGNSSLNSETCSTQIRHEEDNGSGHYPFCSELKWNTSPPTSGKHYGSHAAFGTYTDSVPYGFLVHSLEHGAIVIGYNCPEGCAKEVEDMQAMIDRYPCDSGCTNLNLRRFVLAPDPRINVRWAASAWNWSWKSTCPDTVSLAKFSHDHYAQGLEDLFELGIDLSPQKWCPVLVNGKPIVSR